MYFLRFLGGVSVESDATPIAGSLAQPRLQALLALLSVARDRGTSRDKLIGYLWPEGDQERARHRLANTVYLIRKALGDDALLATGDVLALNPETVDPRDDPYFARASLLLQTFDRRFQHAISYLDSLSEETLGTQYFLLPTSLPAAQVYSWLGRPEAARAYYDTARAVLARGSKKLLMIIGRTVRSVSPTRAWVVGTKRFAQGSLLLS